MECEISSQQCIVFKCILNKISGGISPAPKYSTMLYTLLHECAWSQCGKQQWQMASTGLGNFHLEVTSLLCDITGWSGLFCTIDRVVTQLHPHRSTPPFSHTLCSIALAYLVGGQSSYNYENSNPNPMTKHQLASKQQEPIQQFIICQSPDISHN